MDSSHAEIAYRVQVVKEFCKHKRIRKKARQRSRPNPMIYALPDAVELKLRET